MYGKGYSSRMGWRNTPDGELFCICNEFSCRFLLFICKLSFVEMKHMLGKKLKILLAVGAASAVMLQEKAAFLLLSVSALKQHSLRSNLQRMINM